MRDTRVVDVQSELQRTPWGPRFVAPLSSLCASTEQLTAPGN